MKKLAARCYTASEQQAIFHDNAECVCRLG